MVGVQNKKNKNKLGIFLRLVFTNIIYVEQILVKNIE
jgi:hypothetical protein